MIRSASNGETALQPAPAAPQPSATEALPQAEKGQRWLPRVALAIAIGTAAAAAAWFLWPAPRPTVRTAVYLPHKPWAPLAANAPAGDRETHRRNLVARLKSRFVLSAALRDPKVAQLRVFPAGGDSVEWLEQEMKADFLPGTEILRIELSGDKPEELKALVKAVQDAFVREVVEQEVGEQRKQLAQVRELRQKFELQLKEGKAEQKRLEPMAGDARALVRAFAQQELYWAERELLQAQSELRKARAQLEVAQEREKGLRGVPIPKAAVDAHVGQHPAVKALAAKVQKLEQQIKDNQRSLLHYEDEPSIRGLRQQLQQAREAVAKEQEAVRPKVAEALRKEIGEKVSTSRDALEVKIAELTKLVNALQPEVKRCQDRLKGLTDNGAKIDDLKEDLGHIEELVKKLQAQEGVLDVQLMAAPKRWELVEEASAAHVAAGPGRIITAALAGLACALLAFACLSLRVRVSLR